MTVAKDNLQTKINTRKALEKENEEKSSDNKESLKK